MSKDKRVTDYIAKQVTWQQAILKQLRDAVHQADPEIHETIKWGTPTFERAGPVAWTFCAKGWVHFAFPQGKLLDHQHGLFEEAENDPNSKAKRTIKFRENDKVPKELISSLVTQAIANNLSGNKVDFKVPKPGSREYDAPHEYETFLREHGLWEEYKTRPYFQRKGWIQWIEQAKRPETKQKRMDTMLQELRDGTYMPPKGNAWWQKNKEIKP